MICSIVLIFQNVVLFQDVTSMFTVLSVAGPKSRDLMQEMTHSDMNMHPFTYKYDSCSLLLLMLVFTSGSAANLGCGLVTLAIK